MIPEKIKKYAFRRKFFAFFAPLIPGNTIIFLVGRNGQTNRRFGEKDNRYSDMLVWFHSYSNTFFP